MPNTVDFTRKDVLEDFIADNISVINAGINIFKAQVKANPDCKFDETDAKNYLKNRIYSEAPKIKDVLLEEFKAKDYKQTSIEEIANSHVFYKSDLISFFEKIIFEDVFSSCSDDLDEKLVDTINSSSSSDDKKKKYISSSLKNNLKKAMALIRQNGFSNNVINVESGVQTANAGDSAQFLFISRAILAGFNCSNVDVRSSRYDAVIDYKGLIFKVQVKGVTGNSVSFKDRDRGGRGIDTHNERNIGKRITSKDCDIYAAVDKQYGICYLIPMKDFVDKLSDDQIKSYSVNDLGQFRENWNIVEEMYQKDPRSQYTPEKILEMLKALDK